MKSRIISLLLLVVMVLAMLVSCGDSKEPSKRPSSGGSTGDSENGGAVTEAHWWDNVDFAGKTLTIQLSDAVDNELTPGGKKYMAGPDRQLAENGSGSTGFEKVQNEVYQRNQAALKDLNLKTNYTYITATWGAVGGTISTTEAAATGTPDMYCDMIYDMMGAAISTSTRTFANILQYTTEDVAELGSEYIGGYFNLTRENGYYTDLMDDMSFSADKQFLIAGDYYLDVLRGMLVMPFNMDMYGTLVDANDADGASLYAMVENNEWTWDKLLSFSTVYTGSGTATLESENVLMALSVGGLSATGLIYSTAFQNFNVVANGNSIRYMLKSVDPIINNLFQKAYQVASNNAVVCNESTNGDQTGVLAAKKKFTDGDALFAGPNMLGVIEENEFQEMTKLSILPVPKLSVNHYYNTAVNSRARVGAMSYHAAQRVETSAFIQYQSENSEIVKDEYFNKAMTGKYLAGSGAGKMLTLIYDSIGSNKTMIIENQILATNWEVGSNFTWSQLIKADYFTGHANDISTQYSSAVQAKQDVVDTFVRNWNALSN